MCNSRPLWSCGIGFLSDHFGENYGKFAYQVTVLFGCRDLPAQQGITMIVSAILIVSRAVSNPHTHNKYKTTTSECSEDRTTVVKTESELYTCTRVHAPHTHMKECKAEWQKPQTLNWENLEVFFFLIVQNPSIGQQFSQQPNTTHLRWIRTALQQQLPTIFSLHLFSSYAY